jgi:outer membrane murein-binding lipoprotein Lpp
MGNTKDKLQLELHLLRNDMNALMMRSHAPTTVIQTLPPRTSILTKGLACASVVYLGYRGLHACGYRFSDLFYVTGRKFHNTVATLAAGMQTLTQKVSGLSHGVRDLKENINCGFERVNTDVNAVQTQVETLQDSVERVESSVDRVEEKVEHTRQGIHALCNVVYETLQGLPPSEAQQALREYTQHAPRQIQRLNSSQIWALLENRSEGVTASSSSLQDQLGIGTGHQSLASRHLSGRLLDEDRSRSVEDDQDDRWSHRLSASLNSFLKPAA